MTRVQETLTLQRTTQFKIYDCANCGVLFGLPEAFDGERRADGKAFYCPNGHNLTYGKTEVQRLREQLAQTERRLEAEQGWSSRLSGQLHAEQRSHSATKGQLTKTRNRINNGVCPECNRYFAKLDAHMHTKHAKPDEAQS